MFGKLFTEDRMRLMLEARNIQKTYQHSKNALHVLKGIDLKVEEADVVAIEGPSGVGKSTLLHILGGLDSPTQGKVFFDGKDVDKMNGRQLNQFRNQKVGFIFQFYHLLPEFTALENIMLPAVVAQKSKDIRSIKIRAQLLLEQVHLSARAEHNPNELSGGEQQRVAIARALMNDPQIVLCDEPTGNLDSESGNRIIALLMEMNKNYGKTLLIVTHDAQIAQQANRRIFLKDGSVVNHL